MAKRSPQEIFLARLDELGKDLSQKQITDRAGISYFRITKWKGGGEAVNPQLDTLIALAAIKRRGPEYMISEDPSVDAEDASSVPGPILSWGLEWIDRALRSLPPEALDRLRDYAELLLKAYVGSDNSTPGGAPGTGGIEVPGESPRRRHSKD